jgi:hypothetical protein
LKLKQKHKRTYFHLSQAQPTAGVSNVVTAFSYFWIAHQDWTHEGSFLAALGGSCLSPGSKIRKNEQLAGVFKLNILSILKMKGSQAYQRQHFRLKPPAISSRCIISV